MITIKIYNIQELRNWLESGDSDSLTTDVISQSRAISLVNNPSALPEHPALAEAFLDGKSVGYTAVFPDRDSSGNLWFFGTTGYMDASCRGMGIGTKLYSAMMDATDGRWLAIDSSPAALAISHKTGLNIGYYKRYYLLFQSGRSILGNLKKKQINYINHSVLKNINNGITFSYMRYMEEPVFKFIQNHSADYLFNRTREMYNWILQFPFKTEGPESLINSTKYNFTTTIQQYYIYGIKIYQDARLVGVAIFRMNNGILSLLYWFYDKTDTNTIYPAIVRHVTEQRISQFRTFDKLFIDYFNNLGMQSLNSRCRFQEVTLSYPNCFNVDEQLCLQCGDGDMFC